MTTPVPFHNFREARGSDRYVMVMTTFTDLSLFVDKTKIFQPLERRLKSYGKKGSSYDTKRLVKILKEPVSTPSGSHARYEFFYPITGAAN